jgi:hypothetical protein
MNHDIQDNSEAIEMVPKGFDRSEAMSAFNNLVNLATELSRADVRKDKLRTERAKISAKSRVMITEITLKYQFYHDLLEKAFEGRSESIAKGLEVIDKGIRDNNNELILSGLEKVTDIVKDSPLRYLQHIKQTMSIEERRKLIE